MKPELIIKSDGTKEWYLNGVLHRTDGPAVEYSDGSKEWYLNGDLHRTDGPAVKSSSGSKHWYLNGILHRTDGPALEYSDGSKEWYLNGNYLSKDLFLKLTKDTIKELPLYLGLGHDQFIADRIK